MASPGEGKWFGEGLVDTANELDFSEFLDCSMWDLSLDNGVNLQHDAPNPSLQVSSALSHSHLESATNHGPSVPPLSPSMTDVEPLLPIDPRLNELYPICATISAPSTPPNDKVADSFPSKTFDATISRLSEEEAASATFENDEVDDILQQLKQYEGNNTMELDYSGTSSDYPSGLPPDEQGSSEILENNVQSALLPTNYPEVGLYGGLQDTSADLVYDVPMARHRVRSAAAAWSPVAPTTPPTNQMTVTYASPWDLTTDFLTPATDMRSENVEQFRQFAGSECRSDASMVSRVALAQSEHSNGSLGSPHQRGNTASTGATASYRRLRPRAQPRPRTPEQYSDEESGDLFCSSDEEVGSLIHERKRKRVTKCNSSDSEGETSARKRKCKISGNKQERVLPKLDPNAPRIRINQTTRGINKSSANREADAERKALYDTLPQTPEPWSIFNYERSGDLCRADTYSAKELLTYFYRHPLHSHDNVLDLKQSRLRLRLQVQPAEKSRRDPAGTGRLCRFAKCPTPNNIIHPGDFRIAFDEQGWRGAEENHCHDPYLNAGVVHLDCMERFVDLPGLIRDLNFKVETRDLPLEIGGRNTMSLDKRGWTKRIAPAARAFVKACEKDEVPGDYPRITDYSSDAQRPHAGRLTHRLVKKKIDAEPPGKGKIRIERGDRPTQLHNHMGDEKFRWQEKAKIRRQRRAIREGVREYNSEESEGELARERAAKRERRKRKYLEQDEEENGGEDEEEQYDKFDEAPGRVRMLQYREVDSRPIKKRKF